MTRPDITSVAMATAQLWATRATCPKKHVGACAMTADGRLILAGYNGAPKGMPHCDDEGCDLDANGDCQRSIHAEANIIALAAREGISLLGCKMYITHYPCHKCFQLMISAGISSVIYGEARPQDAISDRVMAMARSAGVYLALVTVGTNWNAYMERSNGK